MLDPLQFLDYRLSVASKVFSVLMEFDCVKKLPFLSPVSVARFHTYIHIAYHPTSIIDSFQQVRLTLVVKAEVWSVAGL